MSFNEFPQNQPNSRESEMLDLQIEHALVDGKKWQGSFNQELLNKISYSVLTMGNENDIAARIGFLAGLKILRGETRCTEANLRVNINGKNFNATYTVQKGWKGGWKKPEIIDRLGDS